LWFQLVDEIIGFPERWVDFAKCCIFPQLSRPGMPSNEGSAKRSMHRVPPVQKWLYPGLTIVLALVGVIELGIAIVSASAGDFNVWALGAALAGFFTCAVCGWMWRQQVLDSRDHQDRQH
jgi:hypothetical protein